MSINVLKAKIGKEFYDMTKDNFQELIEQQNMETLKAIRDDLKEDSTFYKKILAEEFRKKNPNGSRYQHAEKQLGKINAKGQQLKQLMDSKTQKT